MEAKQPLANNTSFSTLTLLESATTPANYLRRIGAYIVDLLMITLIHFSSNLFFVLLLELFSKHSAKAFVTSAYFGTFSQVSDLLCYTGYFTLTLWYFNGFTAGKRLFQIRVQSLSGEINLKQALFRTISYGASYLTLSLGFLLPLFRKDQRALHDLLAQTVVTETN